MDEVESTYALKFTSRCAPYRKCTHTSHPFLPYLVNFIIRLNLFENKSLFRRIRRTNVVLLAEGMREGGGGGPFTYIRIPFPAFEFFFCFFFFLQRQGIYTHCLKERFLEVEWARAMNTVFSSNELWVPAVNTCR